MISADKQRAIDARPCPECGARQGEPCWSRLHDRPMVNEIHRSRWYGHDVTSA